MNNTVKLEKWKVARKQHRLSDTQVQMALELGLNPDKLGKLDNHKQEPWKTPLPQHIESLYYKRFKKESPDTVKSVDRLLKDEKIKKEKERKRKAKLRGDNSLPDGKSEKNMKIEHLVKPLSLSAKLKLYNEKPKIRIKFESGETPETILRKEAHIFDEAFGFYEKESVTLPELGFVLKKIHPGYKPRRYGCKTLGEIYEKLDKYEVIRTDDNNTYNVIRKRRMADS